MEQGLFFKKEIDKTRDKEYEILKFRSKRRNLGYKEHQIGKTNIPIDKKRDALLGGKRMSRNGKIYYEYRKNRSDLKDSMI